MKLLQSLHCLQSLQPLHPLQRCKDAKNATMQPCNENAPKRLVYRILSLVYQLHLKCSKKAGEIKQLCNQFTADPKYFKNYLTAQKIGRSQC